ncbi:hypothetical protein Unana1_01511 [Umbelopsis nana]
MSEQSQSIIVVTGGETYIGYNMALRFCEELERKRSRNLKLRVLCSSKDGMDKLQQRGAEVHVVRYEDQGSLRQHLRQVSLVVLTLNDRDQRAQDARNVIEAANQERAQAIQLISHIGCDRANDNMRGLLDYQQAEECLKDNYQAGKWVIIRLNFVQQFFYLWSPMIEDAGKLRLNVNEDSKFAPVSMIDVMDATIKIACRNTSTEEYGVCDQYNRKTLNLTGSQAITAKEMANELSRAVNDSKISFERISFDQMKKYFEDIREHQRMLLSSMQAQESSGVDTVRQHDNKHLIPQGKYLTDPVINTILGYLELVKDNHFNHTTSDVHKVTGNDPISLKNFFKENRDQFRGRSNQ